MGKTIKGTRAPGTDWWSRRPFSGISVGRKGMKWWKRATHKRERQAAKRET